MSKQDDILSATNIRYLLALNALDNGQVGVRNSQISKRLNVTRATVHTMIKKFCEKGYTTMERRYEAVRLTYCGS